MLTNASGSSCIAVATSTRLLRLYSPAGRQLALISLEGPPIALATPGKVQGQGPARAARQACCC